MIRVISLNKLNCFLSLLMNNSYQWRIQGRGPGGPAPFPLIFRPNLGPKGRKKCFFGDRFPLSEGLVYTYNKFTLNLDLNPESDYFL